MNRFARRLIPLAATMLVAPLLVGAIHGASAQESGVVTVSNANLRGWQLVTEPTSADTGGMGFVDGPGEPPEGVGSLRMLTGDGDGLLTGQHHVAAPSDGFEDIVLSDLAALSYSTYVADRAWFDHNEGGEMDEDQREDTLAAPALHLDVEYEEGVSGTLIFEPAYQGSPVPRATWSRWEAVDSEAMWWSHTPVPGVDAQACSTSSAVDGEILRCTWAEVQNAQASASVTALRFRVGDEAGVTNDAAGVELTPWNGFDGNIDAVTIDVGNGPTTYDFELVSTGARGHDAFALGEGNNEIRRFDLANPLTAHDPVEVIGIEDAETLVGIDFDPATGHLFGVTVDDGGMGRVYDLGPGDGDLQVPALVTRVPFPLPGTTFGTSFDAVADAAGRHLLHVVSDDDAHLTVDTETGVVTTQAPLAHAPSPGDDVQDPRVVSLTHAADGDGGQEALAADLPEIVPHLVEIPQPAGGVLSDRGALTGVLADVSAGLDTAADGSVLAAFSRPGSSFSRLYRIDTADPASAAHVGRIGGSVVDSLAMPPTGTVGFEVDSDDELSGSTTVTVEVEREDGTYGDLSLDVVDVTSDEGSADPADYELKTTEVHFPHGEADAQPVAIEITRPADATGDVTVVLRLEDPRGVGNFVGEQHEFTLTIRGQDRAVIGFHASSDDDVSETDDNGVDGIATLAISREVGDVDQVSALLRVKDGAGDATRGEDYHFPEHGVGVSFPDDDATPNVVEVEVPVINDTEFEGDEVAVFELVDPSAGAEIGANAEHSLTIEDDEPGDVGFAAETFTVDEGDPIDIVVERENGNEGDVTVTVADAGTGNAVAGDDYEAFDPASDTFDGANDANDRAKGVVTIQTVANDALTGDRVVDLELTVEGPAGTGTVNASVVIRDLSGGDAFVLTEDGRLVSFDPADPSRAGSPIEVTDEAEAKVELLGIDFNPHDQRLYGVAEVPDPLGGYAAFGVYEIDPSTGTATLKEAAPLLETEMLDVPYPGAPVLPVAQDFGVDFDASGNVLRVIGSAGQHLVFDIDTWQWSPAGPPLVYPPTDANVGNLPAIAAVGHDANLPDVISNAPESTAYAVDHANDALVTIDPTTGLLVTTGVALGDGITDARAGLDFTTDGRAFAVLTVGGTTTLHEIDLGASTVDPIGAIGGGRPYTDVTFAPTGVLRLTETAWCVNESVAKADCEDTGSTQAMVERVGGTAGTVSVDLTTEDTGSAGVGVDYGTPGGGEVAETLEFTPGVTEQSVTIPIIDDDEIDPDETFTVALANVVGDVYLDPGRDQATVTIEDDPVGAFGFEVTAVSVTEGDPPDDDNHAQLVVTRTGGVEGSVTVDFNTASGDTDANPATEGDDYEAVAFGDGQLAFAHGETDPDGVGGAEILIPIVADHIEELDETFKVQLANPSAGQIIADKAEAVVTILNDDHAGTFVFDPDSYTVSEDAGSLLVTVVRDGGSDGVVSVDFATAETDGEAAASEDVDFATVDHTLTFAHGQDSGDVTVEILDDQLLEGDEVFEVVLKNPSELASERSLFEDPDNPPVAAVTIRDAEPGALFAVARDADGAGAQRLVRFDTARPDTITGDLGEVTGFGTDERIVALDRRPADGDYFALGIDGSTGTLYRLDTTDASMTSVGTLVESSGDPFPLAGVAGMAVDPVRDLVRIVDRDGQNLRVEFPDEPTNTVVVTEDDPVFYGDSSDIPEIASVAFTPVLDGAATQYDLDTAHDRVARQGDENDTATADGGELTPAGFDSVSSGTDTGFTVDEHQRLLAAVSASPSDLWYVDGGHSVGQIGDDLVVDALAAAPAEGTVGFTAESFEAEEGENAGGTADVTVARTGSASGERTVGYRIIDEAGEIVEDDSVTFATGAEVTTIAVPVDDDDVFRDDRQLTLELSDVVGAEVGTRQATLTVLDDDEPTIGVRPSGNVSVREGRALDLTLALSNPTAKETSVAVRTIDGTAKAGIDYQGIDGNVLTFPVDEDEAPVVTLTIPTIDDALDEFDERFTVELRDPQNAALGTNRVTVTIVDDDSAPKLSIGNTRVTEGDSGTRRAVFTVSLSAPSAKQVKVKATTFDRTATAGVDYRPTAATLTFPPGTTIRTFSVSVFGDTLHEPDETFGVLLFGAVNASFASRVGVGTIVDDDEAPQVKDVTVETAPVNSQSTPDGKGYWIATDEGDVFGFGNAERFGSLRGAAATAQIGAPVVDLTATADGDGYWLLDDQGGVFTFGEAPFFGSLPGRVQQGIVGPAEVTDMARTPSGDGYVILDHVGGVHTFGDAEYHGSIPGLRADGQEIGRTRFVSIAVTPDGGGYWIMDRNGGVFTFGNAKYFDSIPGLRAAGVPIGETTFVSLAPTSDGRGYWIVDRHGGVFTFGNAEFHGSIPGLKRDGHNIGNAATASIEPAPGGEGYWIFDEVGGVFTFGSARFAGSLPGLLR